tara:strand:+ start:5897 stop:6601 length:705 start_codon:yes stop_codon:yes gene_type:complete
MNLQKIINNKEKYEKEFEVWKSVSSILNEETNFDKYEGLFFTMFTFLSFLLSFCLNYFLIEFNFETFFLLGIFGTVPITIFLCIFENFLRKIKYKKNIKKDNLYLKLFTVSKTTLIPSLEKKKIQYIKEKTDIVGFNNYLNFKNMVEKNNYKTNYDFINFIISVIEKSEHEEISKISEDELINFLKEFSLKEQELITNKIKEKISKKDLITDNIKNNLKEIKKISVNNNIIKEL